MNLLNDAYCAYINLDCRKDRNDHMQQELARVGITAYRHRAMLPEEYHGHADLIRCMLSRPQKGAIGCYFSQLGIMETAGKQGRHAMVMEDDLVFCQDFLKRVEHISHFCATHPWDVIWLGGTFHVNPPYWHKTDLGRDAEQTDDVRMMRTFGAFSTHAYLVNWASINQIMAWHYKILPKSMGIDWSFIQMEPTLYTYAFVPGCVIQYDNPSNIGSGMTIFSNFKKLGPYWYQERTEDFNPTTFDWHEATWPRGKRRFKKR